MDLSSSFDVALNKINYLQMLAKCMPNPIGTGHGRTERPGLPVTHEMHDLSDEQKKCTQCGCHIFPTPHWMKKVN